MTDTQRPPQVPPARISGYVTATEEELKASMSELTEFNRLSVDRELRMVELKKEINALLGELGRKEKYRTDLGDPEHAAIASAGG